MTVELAVTFPFGRYHATPWDQNANEGAIEWPPSPWRLLRALYATWRNRAPELDTDLVLGLLDELATPPQFMLPPHMAAHTRHYFPGPAHKQGVKTDKTKVLDAFLSISPHDEMTIRWPIDLSADQQSALEVLAERLTYLGRAESLCDVHVRFGDLPAYDATASATAPARNESLVPLPDDTVRPDSVSLLVPTRPLDEESLTISTTTLRRTLRRREPPHTQRVLYPRPSTERDAQAARVGTFMLPTAVRWSLAASTRPSRFAAVAFADTLRSAALSKFGGAEERSAPATLTGKSTGGARGFDQHRHAHWFAFANPRERLLSTVAVWSPDGFDEEMLDALARIQKLTQRGLSDMRSTALGLEGWGDASTILPELTGPAMSWTSFTPFAPTRHQHKSDGSFEAHVERSVTDELNWRSLPGATVTVDTTPGDWRKFRRHRPSKEKLAKARPAVPVHLEFDVPVDGPIALGALSHFGLGLFMPTDCF